MKCEELYHWLQAYLDAEVTPEEERLVEKHIRGCAQCRRRLVELGQTINRISDQAKLTPKQDFTKQLWAKLQQEREQEKRR